MRERATAFFWPHGAMLSLIAFLSMFLQLHNVSHYNVYPDSYQSVTVAQNLKNYHRLAAPLGQNGLVYPDFFGWTRPLYPLLILFFSLFGMSLFTAAHVVSILAGCLAIFAIYALTNCVLKSKAAGLIAALLLAISYNHAVWGGFILTEPLGILMLSLALWQLWRNKTLADNWFINKDILTGLIFALAILTRYEYFVLLLPAALIADKKRAASIISTALLAVILALALLHPFSGGWAWIWGQIKDYIFVVIGIAAIILIGYFAIKSRKANLKSAEQHAAKIAVGALVLAWLLLIIDHSIYSGLWVFAINDPLLTYGAFAGLVLLLLSKKAERRLGFMLLAGLIILGAVYYHINPNMDRYITHLLPIMLVAAGYGILRLVDFKTSRLMVAVFGLFLCLQIIKTWQGLHHIDRGIWFKQGYEEKSAKTLNSKLNTSKDLALGCSARRPRGTEQAVQNGTGCLLIASMPEPYYLFTGIPTQSIADTPPYIFAKLPAQTKLVIIDDQGMQAIFPRFASFIQKNLSQYQTAQYPVGEPLRYTTSIIQEQQPVKIYKLNYSDFQKFHHSK
jgi:4-amino-4-deoxy-L-arabinose transferase-like glycosyltransferase